MLGGPSFLGRTLLVAAAALCVVLLHCRLHLAPHSHHLNWDTSFQYPHHTHQPIPSS